MIEYLVVITLFFVDLKITKKKKKIALPFFLIKTFIGYQLIVLELSTNIYLYSVFS